MYGRALNCIVILMGLIFWMSAHAKEPIRLFPKQGKRFFRIPGLAVTTKGTVLAFAGERKGSVGDFGHDTDVVVRRSTDGGVTWAEPKTILSAKGIDFHSGPVVVDRQTGSIFKFARSHGAKSKPGSDWRDNFILQSDDDGKTWTRSLLTLKNERASFRFGPGNGGHGIQLTDGRLVIHGGYWRVSGGKKRMSLCLIESRDQGKSWHVMKGSDLDNAHVEFCIAETVAGRIYINIREKYTPMRLYTFIDPGKSSISEAKQVSGLPSAQCRAGMVKVQEADTAYLYFTGPTGKGRGHAARRDLSLFRCNLEGSLWERVALIHQGKAAYSDLAELPNGDLACLYESGDVRPDEEILFLRIPKPKYLPNKELKATDKSAP